MMKHYLILSLLFISLSFEGLLAQERTRELPFSFSEAFSNRYGSRELRQQRLPRLDMKRIQEEDAINPGTRFAAPIWVNFSPDNAGDWTILDNGDAVWRLKLESEGALAMTVLYDNFFIPEGGKLFMYSGDGKQVLGPFTSKDNTPAGKFITGLTRGASAILEYYEPKSVRGQGRMHIFRVDHAYHRQNLESSGFNVFGVLGEELGFGTSGDCHSNVKCPEGTDFSKERRAVCRILLVVQEGTGFCTGSLINNTRNDGRPFLISAFHCQDGYVPLFDFWRFDFNYESADCANPTQEPAYNSIVGCTARAGRRENDFLLLELSAPVPPSFNAYFLGWNRSNAAPSNGAAVHHPRGDIKKLAIDNDGVRIFMDSIKWNNEVTTAPSHHFQVRYDFGTFDIGSSGCALLDQNHNFVGQLHGGNQSCTGATAYFGRLFLSWEGGGSSVTRLKDWLDPDNTQVFTLNGIENPTNAGAKISGMVLTASGAAISGAKVQVVTSKGFAISSVTDTSGYYELSGVPYDDAAEVAVSKTDFISNGLSTMDLIRIQKHILNIEPFTTPYQWLAADVNNSRTVSTLDLIQVRKVILGLEESFPSVPNWRFFPVELTLPNPPNPFSGTGTIPTAGKIANLSKDILDFDFFGIKSGDVNGSANPKN